MQFLKQDLTKLRVKGPILIAHGVNCQRVMGSGVALAFCTKWPSVKTEYLRHLPQELGDVGFVIVDEHITVANCWTQITYGRTGVHARTDAIECCMGKCAVAARTLDTSTIYIPRIGCGLGGLNWDRDVEPLLVELEERCDVEFIVCDL
jgi:O-acetyl-ADP-ribose deacetylase (regulator of RNase III)